MAVLKRGADRALQRMTSDEVLQMGDPYPVRLAKILLVALAKTSLVEESFGAESTKPDVKKVLRIMKRQI